MRKDILFDVGSVVYIGLLIVLMLLWWGKYPIFVDIYYHLSVMSGFSDAGGVVLTDFWEFAPLGRPHLYPPLLHIFMLALFKTGFSVNFIGKLVSFMLFPAQLLSLFVYMRQQFSSKAAFFSILILSTPLAYLWANSVISASALVLFFAPLLFLTIEKGKKVASPLLLALSLYSHLGIAHTTAIALILYGIINPARRRICFSSVIAGYILYLPWAFHTLLNISYLHRTFDSSIVDPSTTIYLPMVFLALVGMVVAFKEKEKSGLLPLCYIVAMMPVAFTAPNRFWLSCGGMPFAMLGGIGLDHATRRMEVRVKRKSASLVFAGIVFLSLLLFNPTVRVTPDKGLAVRNEYPLLPSLLTERGSGKDNLENEETNMLLGWIEKNTSRDDVLFVSNPPLGCLITAYTGRAQTSGMFREVLPYRQTTPRDASFILIERGDFPEGKRVAEIGRVSVYERNVQVKRNISEPVLSVGMAFLIVFLSFALILIDALRGTP